MKKIERKRIMKIKGGCLIPSDEIERFEKNIIILYKISKIGFKIKRKFLIKTVIKVEKRSIGRINETIGKIVKFEMKRVGEKKGKKVD